MVTKGIARDVMGVWNKSKRYFWSIQQCDSVNLSSWLFISEKKHLHKHSTVEVLTKKMKKLVKHNM